VRVNRTLRMIGSIFNAFDRRGFECLIGFF
jgi:hypothetical protein